MSEAITEEVIEKMASPKKKPSGPALYINAGTDNIFTTKGRCMPGRKIRLSAKEAGQHGKLERC